jgi:hypothetical protein
VKFALEDGGGCPPSSELTQQISSTHVQRLRGPMVHQSSLPAQLGIAALLAMSVVGRGNGGRLYRLSLAGRQPQTLVRLQRLNQAQIPPTPRSGAKTRNFLPIRFAVSAAACQRHRCRPDQDTSGSTTLRRPVPPSPPASTPRAGPNASTRRPTPRAAGHRCCDSRDRRTSHSFVQTQRVASWS